MDLEFTRIPTLPPIVNAVEAEIGTRALRNCFHAQSVDLDYACRTGAILPLRDLLGLFEHFARSFGDEAFGIFAARAIRPESFGLFAAHAAQAPSCQAAILRACRTVRFHQNGSVMRLYSDGLSTTWSYKLGLPLTTGRHHHAVHSLLTLFASMVSYIGHVPKLIEVGLEAPAYGTAEVLEKLFNAPIRWSCNSNYLRFPSELLLVSRSPSAPVHSPVTFSDLMRYARSAPPDSCAEKTTAAIRICMAKGEISLEAVARYLNKGPRTVQRQLAREGFTFNEILEGLRLERAEELIIETQLPLKQISSLLCYSDPAHFTRAYHRWKGLSPSERRQVILM